MIRPRFESLAVAAALAALLLTGGCSSLPLLNSASPIATGSTGQAGVQTAPDPAVPEVTRQVAGNPTDVYAGVARGALNCWFGADGPLKATHIFSADASPAALGGGAEIVVHERDPSAERDPRGIRAFRVTFASSAGGVRVGIANLKFASPRSEAMIEDVSVWAGGGQGCALRKVADAGAATLTATPTAAPAAKPGR